MGRPRKKPSERRVQVAKKVETGIVTNKPLETIQVCILNDEPTVNKDDVATQFQIWQVLKENNQTRYKTTIDGKQIWHTNLEKLYNKLIAIFAVNQLKEGSYTLVLVELDSEGNFKERYLMRKYE